MENKQMVYVIDSSDYGAIAVFTKKDTAEVYLHKCQREEEGDAQYSMTPLPLRT